MGVKVNIICRNWKEDRVLPRFSRYLADGLGWTLTPAPVAADVHYLMGYFECQVCPGWPNGYDRIASLFTHREENDARKADLFDRIAGHVGLRVAMCRLYGEPLSRMGPTIQPPLPVERERFTIAARPRRARKVVGLAGYTYKTHRKGEDLTAALLRSPVASRVDWRASGRGWPVQTRAYFWKDMPRFYQGLDVLVCPSLVEGGPMPVLEALSCGVPVVIPRGVGILDEIPEAIGVWRYARGNADELVGALAHALADPGDRERLRALTEPYTVEAWCEAHRLGFAQRFEAAA